MKDFFSRFLANVAEPTSAVANDGPDEAAACIAKGHGLEDAGDLQGALAAYRRASDLDPDSPRAKLNIGNAFKLLGRAGDAEVAYNASIELDPDYAEGHMNLGNLCLEAGAFTRAEKAYREALRCREDWTEARFGLGCALRGAGRADEAVSAFQSVLQRSPGHDKSAAALAALLVDQGRTADATALLLASLQHDPGSSALNIALSGLERNHGECESALGRLRIALDADPGNKILASSYLFGLNFLPGISSEEVLREHLRLAPRFSGGVVSAPRAGSGGAGKRLKVGYVSPDFRRHSVSCFFEPVLRHHDRSAFEVHCYFSHHQRDDITERFESLSDGWLDIAGMDDEAVARRISGDGIDILVDLAGHTTGNRLGVFARRPSPVQMTWLGYLCTTGLDFIDYRICDVNTDPPGLAEQWQVETPARLPDSQWCYQPQVAIRPPSSLPRLSRGFWTFGSFNQSSKINAAVLQAWAKVLAAIPDSRLRIHGVADAAHAVNIREAMAANGIESERIETVGRIPIDSYFDSFKDVDVAFDTFPYNGATTSLDSLIMGVPVACVAGNRPIARGGLSLMKTLDLMDWVASSPQGLPGLVVEQTRNVDRLAELRAALPDRLRGSALMDGARFTKNLEAIYRAAWCKVCDA